ncbi:unnamed protein product [Cuscuta epithymum]|uniref:Uncharacterized protein n=1 Tax=Cuscuta epithymum TaxID=186058 RepID=A0AAV0EX16_9ASTE|nr:unnamed protein product [Cuscuta epithymum]
MAVHFEKLVAITAAERDRDHIFSTFSALIRGLALAMASLPAALKSKVQPCISGYRWLPQKVTPHLHLNPVSPTLFRHVEHLFAGSCTSASAADAAAIFAGGPDGDGEMDG